ncbi:MAG TPA: hypothetical protein VFJ68_08905 [Casimicrobiaceae bacterium]|nr:hypothetical protein [Casimicrobiaceae bacterium]
MGVDSGGLYSNVPASPGAAAIACAPCPMVFCRMPDTPRPSLLDKLRQRSEEVQARRAAARLPEEKARHAIDGALWRAFRWLDEAMGHLEVIRPDVRHRFQLGDYLTFEGLQIDSGFAAFRRHGLGTGDRLVLGESNAFLHRAPLAYVNSRR